MYSVCAVIEHVHAMPKQGVSSTFKFGVGYGGLRMALIAASIPFEEVTPRTWQKALGVVVRKKTETKTQFKNRLKAKAQQLFPRESITLKTADALLIAEYCRRKQLGLL
jgi:Holliday junction resolvasome RuvABC endonuclease subunit